MKRLLTCPSPSDEAYDFEKQYFAEQDATRTVRPEPAKEREKKKEETKKSTHYGGQILQKGDNDKKKVWGGKQGEKEGKLVEELQKDLVKLGYRVTKPSSGKGKGMLAVGDFGANVENAVKTAHLELLCLKQGGEVDASKKNKITGKVDADTAKAIKDRVAKIGNKTWDRPGHKPKSKWEEPPTAGAYTPNKEYKPDSILFYQVPPSPGYYRREVVEYGSRPLKTRDKKPKVRDKPILVFEDDDASWLMVDCWGQNEQIDLLKKIGDEWLKTSDGKERKIKLANGTEKAVRPFYIGDIAMFNDGAVTEHAGHREGDSTDLNCSESSNINSANRLNSEQDMLETLELMKLFHKAGAKNIYFNCHHVIANCDIAQYADGHSNHVHMDGPKYTKASSDKRQKKTTRAVCARLAACDDRIYRVRDSANEHWYASALYDIGILRLTLTLPQLHPVPARSP